MKRIVGVIVLMSSVSQVAVAETDCALAQRYYVLSTKSAADYKQDDAYAFLVRAAEACPTSYSYLQESGEAAAAFGTDEYNVKAAEAFVAAYAVATTESEQARTLSRYAALVFHTNGPLKAVEYIHQAQTLDPTDAEIAALGRQIDTAYQNATPGDVKRGVAKLAFQPLTLQRSIPPDAHDGQMHGGSGKPSYPTGDSIPIPLNFEFNSTQLDPQTSRNIAALADELAGPKFARDTFEFVGHADRRGTADANRLLSERRADAIREQVCNLQPSLKGRIRTAGRGAEDPIAPGDTEQDYRLNRRLQVVVRSAN